MAFSLTATVSILFVSSFLISASSSADPFDAFFIPPTPTPPPQPQISVPDQSYSITSTLSPILSQLGLQDLAAAVPSLSVDAASASWDGPSTIFAPSDASLRRCSSCSVPNLLREHIVPGLFTADYLRKLAFGTKIETLSPGRCLTVTSENVRKSNHTFNSAAKIFVEGVAVTHPDLFSNGLVVVHEIKSYISPLSPFSCDVERTTSLPFSTVSDRGHQQQIQSTVQPAIMRLMLRDAILRLRNNGFSILSLALKVRYVELMSLTNMTVFALDDASILTGSYGYISNVRFHIVPNHFLTIRDLESLPLRTLLPTLEGGASLVITTAGAGDTEPPMRINFVRVRIPEMMRNLKIVVHSVFLPFPRIDPAAAELDGIEGGAATSSSSVDRLSPRVEPMEGGLCTRVDENGNCAGTVTVTVSSVSQVQQGPASAIEQYY